MMKPWKVCTEKLIVVATACLSLHAQAAEKITIDGSTGVTPLVAALVKACQSQHPDVTIAIGRALGTKARIQALNDGKIDIALASHGLNVAVIQRQGMAVHEIAKIAQELATATGAIGMTTTVVEQSKGRVRAVSLRGIAPMAENVQHETYTLTHDSFLVVKTPPSPAVALFLAFVRGPAGEKVIAANGAVPVR